MRWLMKWSMSRSALSVQKMNKSYDAKALYIDEIEVMNKRILKSAIIVSMEEYDYFIGGFKGGLRA